MEEEPAITLGQALKASDLVGSGGEAKVLIQAGEVLVNGEVETRRGRKLAPGAGAGGGAGGVGSGWEARVVSRAGRVLVSGEVETRRGRKLAPGDVVEVGDERLEVG